MERQQRKQRDLPSNLPLQVYQALNQAPLTFRNKDNTPTTTTTTTTTDKKRCDSQVMPTTGNTAEETPPPPLTTAPPAPDPPAEFSVESSDSSETNGVGSETKRRKVRGLESRIVRGAGVMARAMLAREEKRERRHRDLMGLEERRLRIEEARVELNRRAISGLVSAVDNLSKAIQAIVSDRRNNAT
ncbi:hypothetical protein Sjap_014637 [Stephania japonica]|uniref:Uncharacterized protein n=1 Tax=Stephania japonica TaxID=461633 RepID=A0AAP0NS36_9MAGN